ncbi:MAG: DUF4129 domain-containing protein [Candidatus Hydrogenedentes bacterium]|nr:DUF4129 domain-containing protein [Candidatus Hydrogenedentota bacterium]
MKYRLQKSGRRPSLASTDFHSLMRAQDPEPEANEPDPGGAPTDFRSLTARDANPVTRTPPRTATDMLIDGLTPLLIFVMCYTVLFFLLDVRFIYTEVNDISLRWVAFFFLVGIVASNRLLARDNSPEGFLYPIIFGGSMGLYTLSISTFYENSSSVARNFMNDAPWIATAFNVAIVVLIWWVVNRLTHECCVDENKTAGDVGILTGAARKFQRRMRSQNADDDPAGLYASASHAEFAREQGKAFMPMNVLEPFDPAEGYKPRTKPAPKYNLDFSQRLSDKHPGISILYFSVPVMLVFTLGIRVVQQGGPGWVAAGHFYAGIYTLAALLLLLLTSLGGIRQYFRARMIAMPAPMGYFWLGLGVVMAVMVLVAAARLPGPDLPPMAAVGEHQTDFWSRGSTFALAAPAARPMELLEASRAVELVGNGVLILFGLFGAYLALNRAAAGAAWMARHRHRFPGVVGRFFDWLERALTALTHLPSLPNLRGTPRIDRGIATCAHYENSLGSADRTAMSPADHVAYAYEALCALAYDLGVPREAGQTPYEFIGAFPAPLRKLKAEARELTRLYVQSAYSPRPLSPDDERSVRRFWVAYNQARRRVLR